MRFALIFVFAARAFACNVLAGDRITGKDLAAANPMFAAIDPAMVIGPAPIPGVERILHPEELRRIVEHNAITIAGATPEICFERATEPLTAEKILPVLRAALGLENARIEILDFSHTPIPHGDLLFDRAGLAANGLWRGHVNFDENRSIPVWARVRVTTEQSWVEAAEPLAAGKPVDSAQLKLVTGPRFPFGPAPVDSLDQVAGRATLRTIKPGEVIFANMLIAPREVERGDKVSVDVSSGAAHLSFDGVSQSSGRAGETILIKNPDNGRLFQARITGKDKVSINK